MSFTITLPLPPSTNALYRGTGKRRVKTRAYADWRRSAILSIFAQVRADRGIRGPVSLRFYVPLKMRGDIDNRLKATIDALVGSRRIDDDKHVHSISIHRDSLIRSGTIEVKAEAV